jgi:hypothetical protein
MNQTWSTLFIAMNIALLLAVLTLSHNWKSAQAQDTTPNDTRMILNVKDNTITLVNTTSNETISIRNLTADTENMITNESKSTNNLTVGTENMINNESLSGNNITENAENTRTNLSLTEKFKELQGQ